MIASAVPPRVCKSVKVYLPAERCADPDSLVIRDITNGNRRRKFADHRNSLAILAANTMSAIWMLTNQRGHHFAAAHIPKLETGRTPSLNNSIDASRHHSTNVVFERSGKICYRAQRTSAETPTELGCPKRRSKCGRELLRWKKRLRRTRRDAAIKHFHPYCFVEHDRWFTNATLRFLHNCNSKAKVFKTSRIMDAKVFSNSLIVD